MAKIRIYDTVVETSHVIGYTHDEEGIEIELTPGILDSGDCLRLEPDEDDEEPFVVATRLDHYFGVISMNEDR